MNYFGTDLKTHGHYFWQLDGDTMNYMGLCFDHFPFDPETILQESRPKGATYYKGECGFFQVNGWSIIAIEGGCIDKRGGTKSVFFVKENLNKQEMKERIESIPVAKKILSQMPFQVKWDE